LRDRLFPERQIIFRSRGDVRYIALSTRTQLLMATGIVMFAGWIGYSSVNVFYRSAMLDARDRRIAELSLAYDRLAADFNKNQENFVTASRDLEDRYQRLYEMAMKQRGPVPGGEGGADAKVAVKPKDKPTPPVAAEPPAETKVTEARPAEKDSGKQVVASLDAKPDGAEDVASVEDLEAMLRESKAKPPVPAVKPRDIETRLLSVRGRQRELLDELAQRTDKSVSAMEKALARTGLDLAGMLNRAAEARADVGIGGPLRALGLSENSNGVAVASAGDAVERDMASLEGKLGRWGELLALAQRLPLAVPMQGDAEVSSSYGRRVDPFTKQWAFHAGTDFIGPVRAPVTATAPGVVVFSGRKGPYGRTVEIDHGLGVKTRYAHLSAISVQTGDVVAFGKQLGTMGSTGRSTGQHLHYEILLDDEQIDPSKFIEAGYHVFKQQENHSSAR
jgi:murein DD-endopeptidase MepM/ murein hydrolase activator NlpD